jgi:hypothetical protein
MSFQAYLDNIQAKTGQSPDAFRRLAAEKGFTDGTGLKKGVKAGEILAWLEKDYGLGRGHGMAIVALLKGAKKPGDS